MSAGVSGVTAAGAAEWARVQRPASAAPGFAPQEGATPRAPQPGAAPPAVVLSLPEEQAFKVATINERLASTAARAETAGAAVDLKA